MHTCVHMYVVVIVDAVRRFFQSKVQEESLKNKGKYSEKVKHSSKKSFS